MARSACWGTCIREQAAGVYRRASEEILREKGGKLGDTPMKIK
jgi:hypothetical protein